MLAKKNYRWDIQGLRALAVLAVVIFHISPSRLPGGYLGVDIFFAAMCTRKNLIYQPST